MAGNNSVVDSNTILVKWQQDKASFKKVKKELTTGFAELKSHSPFAALKPSEIAKTQMQYRRMLRQMKKDRDKILGADFKVSVGSKGGRGGATDKTMHPNRADYAKHLQQQAKEQNAVEKAIQQRQERELKRELDLYKIQQKRTQEYKKQNKPSKQPKIDNWEARRERFTSTRAYQTQGLRYGDAINPKNDKILRARADIKSARSAEQYTSAVKRLNTALAKNSEAQRRANAAKRNGTVLNERLAASTRQLVGELASVYVAYEGIKSVVQTGMEFEKINKMFLSVSKNSHEAGENFEFLKGQAKRLGLDLKQSGKEYSRYLAMVNENFSKTQAQELFVSMSELATVRGLSQEQIGRANVAVSQMLSKGKIGAEELRQQLSETGISDAFNMMARAAKEAGVITGKTTSELQANLNKLMESGKAISYEILPYFTKQLHEAARKNDALNYALKNLFSVQLGRAKLNMQLFSNEIWKGGLLEGMRQLLDVFNDFSIVSQPFAKFIGVTIRNALITVTAPFKIVLQLVKDLAAAFGIKFDGDLATQLAKWVGLATGLVTLSLTVGMLAKSFGLLFRILSGGAILKATGKVGALLKVLGGVYALHEMMNSLDETKPVKERTNSAISGLGSALAMSGNKQAMVAGGIMMAGGQAQNYLDKHKDTVGGRAANAAIGGQLSLFTGSWMYSLYDYLNSNKKPQEVPQMYRPYGMGQQAQSPNLYGGNANPQRVDVNLTVKGTDGLIEVIQDTSSNIVTNTINKNEERLGRGWE